MQNSLVEINGKRIFHKKCALALLELGRNASFTRNATKCEIDTATNDIQI